MAKPRLLGMNHVALEVGDIDEALAFYGRIFEFELRGRIAGMAFVDMGDQFVALAAGRAQPPDRHRHVGFVVDDKAATRRALEEAGATILPGRGLDFLDPWGNLIQVVAYGDVQFTKTPQVLRALGADGLRKSEQALAELRAKGIEVDQPSERLPVFPTDGEGGLRPGVDLDDNAALRDHMDEDDRLR